MLTSGIIFVFITFISGSTVCTVLFNGTKVYCANAGDSRAIKVAFVGTQNEQGGSLTRKSKFDFCDIFIRDLN
jgi:hypothetical protein